MLCGRSCETEEQTVARRAADRSRAKRRRTTETFQQTEVRRAAQRSRSQRGRQLWSAMQKSRDAAAVTPREPKLARQVKFNNQLCGQSGRKAM